MDGVVLFCKQQHSDLRFHNCGRVSPSWAFCGPIMRTLLCAATSCTSRVGAARVVSVVTVLPVPHVRIHGLSSIYCCIRRSDAISFRLIGKNSFTCFSMFSLMFKSYQLVGFCQDISLMNWRSMADDVSRTEYDLIDSRSPFTI